MRTSFTLDPDGISSRIAQAKAIINESLQCLHEGICPEWETAVVEILTSGSTYLTLLEQVQNPDPVTNKLRVELAALLDHCSDLSNMINTARAIPIEIRRLAAGFEIADFCLLLGLDDGVQESQFIEINTDRMKFWAWENLIRVESAGRLVDVKGIEVGRRRALATVMQFASDNVRNTYCIDLQGDSDPIVQLNAILAACAG